jgi:hypothetical protein
MIEGDSGCEREDSIEEGLPQEVNVNKDTRGLTPEAKQLWYKGVGFAGESGG